MTDPVDPISGRRKTPDRRAASRRAKADAPSAPDRRNAVVLAGAPVKHDRVSPPPPKSDTATAAFAAQLLGQPGAKRGLRGGPEVIDGAHSAYLQTEFLGPGDRRRGKGRAAKTEI
jgi:hypothetical protein